MRAALTRLGVHCRREFPFLARLSIHRGVIIDSHTGLQHVARGRTDIFVDVEEFGDLQLAKLPSRYREVYNAGLVQNTPVYIYLHQRHAALAPRLAEVLSKMKSSGAVDRHIATALGEEPRD